MSNNFETLRRNSDMSSSVPTIRLACVMVGLPARGKTYISRKIARYLTWLGHRSRIFNVGNYRRGAFGAVQPSDFFDPDNAETSQARTAVAMAALDDMIRWFELGGLTATDGSLNYDPYVQSKEGAEHKKRFTQQGNVSSPAMSPEVTSTPCGAGVGGPACIALYDATNSTIERRETIARKCREHNIELMFIESICDDPEVIMANIKEVKLSSPDYVGCEPEKAAEDFKNRIRHYQKSYETISSDELDSTISYVKLINVGNQVIVNKIRGYIQSRIVYFLMNLNITPRSFYFCRHGESLFNVAQRIGGDARLSPRGELFASKLPDVVQAQLGNDTRLTVWTSTLKRTIQSAQHLNWPQLRWKQLDELDSGVCDGLTYEEIEQKYPQDFAERDNDKYNYRYHGGESYRDLVQRLEPVILELERHHEANHSILIIGHQAVLRAIYAYFHNHSLDELPYIKVPLHTVVKLTPKAYGCVEERFKVDVPAVDTHRPKPSASSISSFKSAGSGLLNAPPAAIQQNPSLTWNAGNGSNSQLQPTDIRTVWNDSAK